MYIYVYIHIYIAYTYRQRQREKDRYRYRYYLYIYICIYLSVYLSIYIYHTYIYITYIYIYTYISNVLRINQFCLINFLDSSLYINTVVLNKPTAQKSFYSNKHRTSAGNIHVICWTLKTC